MKKIICLAAVGVVAIGAVLFLLVTAQHTPPEKTGEDFLTAFYTSTTQEEPWVGNPKATVALKRETFETFFTKDAFMVFLAEMNWDMMQFQVAVRNDTCRPENIVLQPQENGDYSFELTLVICDEQTKEVVKEVAQKGTMRFDNRGKLTDFSIKMFDANKLYS